jgi:hypothetical protein
MNSYHLNAEYKREERETIKHILIANKYDASIVDTNPKIRNKKENEGKIWTKFTYTGKETKSITKLFKNSIVKISYTTRNTIARLLTEKSKPKESKFEASGVYQLTCPDCNMKYIGQTGTSFQTRFSEHFRDFKYATQKSRFAQHTSVCLYIGVQAHRGENNKKK